MHQLTDCLGSRAPRVFDARMSIPQVGDAVAWALDLFAQNAVQTRMQTGSNRDGHAAGITLLDSTDAASLARFTQGILHEEPVHGSLDLLQFGTDGGTVRDGADWVWHIAQGYFLDALKARNPLGFYIKATLWLSAGEHRYAAHCDLADGFLVHLHGHKRVRVWPIPERHRQQPVFNHEDFAGRMSTDPVEIDLHPGQILFLPGGSMHDVVARKAGPAVSVSLHMGSPYPLLTLCDELNALLGFADVTIPPHMQSREKFGIYLFEPARFAGEALSPRDRLPPTLAGVLLGVLQSRATDGDALRRLLEQWWMNGVTTPHYRTPYP